MRRILSLALLTSAILPALVAGDAPTSPAATAPATTTAEATASKPATLTATLSKNANVRYAPSTTKGALACSLKSGATVGIIGVSTAAPDWFVIRLPVEAKVWMHAKNLTPQDGGKTFVVNEDRAAARSDSRITSTRIAEVAKGEIVEARGQQVGDWHPVSIPSATAYIFKGVVTLTPELNALLAAAGSGSSEQIAQVWVSAQKRYDAYRAALNKDLNTAAILDWTYLSSQLAEVIAKHPDAKIQEAAQRMQDGITRVVTAVEKVQREHHVTPVRNVPGEDPIPEPAQVAVTTPATTTVVTTAAPVPSTATPAATTGESGKTVTTAPEIIALKTNPPVLPAIVTPPPSAMYPAAGYIEEKPFPQVGTTYVVIDENQNVLAFLKPKAGSTIQLNDYFWNFVGVKGSKSAVDQTKHNLGKDIPLIEVEDVVLLRR